ncbi:MAG: hypothetical protein FJ161_02820 [Gammaproteobacteria bacterium]|nr:hypothetical protein [Gammaproteobacteria bacterium]
MDQYKKRHNARCVAAQCLYSTIINPQDSWKHALDALQEIENNNIPLSFDRPFTEYLIETCLENADQYEEALSPHLKHGIRSLHPIDRAIVWIACCELNQKPLLTTRAIILNECLTLIRELSEEQSVKFLNALLDRYANDLGLTQ